MLKKSGITQCQGGRLTLKQKKKKKNNKKQKANQLFLSSTFSLSYDHCKEICAVLIYPLPVTLCDFHT